MVRVHGAGGLERTLKAVVVDVVANADRWGKRGKAVRRVIAAIGGVAVAFFSAYPGAKEFAIDLVRPPAIAATADGATPQDESVGGPVVDLTCTPQANFVDSPAHRSLSKRFGRPLRGTNARLELAAARHQSRADG